MDNELHSIQIVGVAVVLITAICSIISIYCCIAFCPSCQKKSSRLLHWRRRSHETSRSFDGLDRITTTDSVSNIYVTSTSGSHPAQLRTHVQALALDNTVYTSIDDEEGGFRHGLNGDDAWHTHFIYENLPGHRNSFDPPPPYPGRVRNAQPLNAAGLLLHELRQPVLRLHHVQPQVSHELHRYLHRTLLFALALYEVLSEGCDVARLVTRSRYHSFT